MATMTPAQAERLNKKVTMERIVWKATGECVNVDVSAVAQAIIIDGKPEAVRLVWDWIAATNKYQPEPIQTFDDDPDWVMFEFRF